MLVKTIITRDWTASALGKRAPLFNVTKGLSPFTLMNLTDNDVATMIEADGGMYKATVVLATEYKQ